MKRKLSKLTASRLAVLFLVVVGLTPYPVRASVKSDFAGVWQGQLSSLPLEIKVWETHGQWNATLFIQNQSENLEVLGWKETPGIFYFFRPADVACISMFVENGAVTLAYFELDAVRKVVLTRKT